MYTNHAMAHEIEPYIEPIEDLNTQSLEGLLQRIGNAKVVLLGEATHGTSEFYKLRARITQELIEKKGFKFLGVEADWPDAARIDQYVRHMDTPANSWKAFARFPTWMWRNKEVDDFIRWLHKHNSRLHYPKRVAFYGLDIYSMHRSIGAVLDYLKKVNPELAQSAQRRYSCLDPWQHDPAKYGYEVLYQDHQDCEKEVISILNDLLQEQLVSATFDRHLLDAIQNARVVKNAEKYYRFMYYGAAQSWNLRDQHMYETLMNLITFHDPNGKAIVWEHNSHIGNARATEMSARGELNLGQLCREKFGNEMYSLGFGTDHGTVAAAADWDQAMEIKNVNPSRHDSYEWLFHQVEPKTFFLPMRHMTDRKLLEHLEKPRLERAIGVVYHPETERQSHYFRASLPKQFDEFVWIDETHAITPLITEEIGDDMPETYPFGL